MRDIRKSIEQQRFPEFIQEFMHRHYQHEPIPVWIRESLKAVNVDL